MVLVPERDFNNLVNPTTALMKSVSDQIYNVDNKNIPDDTKVLYDAELISKMNHLRSPQSRGLTQEQIIEKIPKTFQNRARTLLNTIGDQSWSHSGHFIKDGTEIPGTNIVDLLHRAVVEGNKREVAGWNEFLNTISVNNVPLISLNKATTNNLFEVERAVRPRRESPSIDRRYRHPPEIKTKIPKKKKEKDKQRLILPISHSPVSRRTRLQSGRGLMKFSFRK